MRTYKQFKKDPEVAEALDMAARRKIAIRMRRLSKRMVIARKRAMKRAATPDVLKKRAVKQAKNMLIKKFTKGMDKSDMTITKRAEIEKRLKKMSGRIKTIALKMIPKIRQKEIARRKQMAAR
tara:strand:- start:3571 stop:3939 length:369 start_codon:yes stop_codon:yes gene_type:complete